MSRQRNSSALGDKTIVLHQVPAILSPDADFNRRLVTLTQMAVPRILERARTFRPRALLLMGSGAVGEAVGVKTGERILPLSDLDLALLIDGTVDTRERQAFTLSVERELDPTVRELGLLHNPLDLGVLSHPCLRQIPITLEFCEAAQNPVVLAGDPRALAEFAQAEPAPFEALRLLLNRIAETLLPREQPSAAGPHGSHGVSEATARNPSLPFPLEPPDWSPDPSPASWRCAHRWSKLVLDPTKALLAVQGCLEPSIRKRVELLRPDVVRAGSPGMLELRPAIQAWAGWRLTPSWPPPAVPVRALARFTGHLINLILERLGIERRGVSDGRIWRRLLACEGGATRERIRRWRMMLRRRPRGFSGMSALQLSLRWGATAWPASLAVLAFALLWLRRMEALPEAGAISEIRAMPKAGGLLLPERLWGVGKPSEVEMVLWARHAGV